MLKGRLYLQKRISPFSHLYPKRCQGFLNQWFAQYAEAKAYLKTNGGFLLPYGTQFFICQSDYIDSLGLDPNDSDWQKIDWDWAKPLDKTAWKRLDTTLQELDKKGGQQS